MRWILPLLLCGVAWAGDIASHVHLVKITTDRGFSKQTLAAPALCVGKDGLFLAVGFALDKPEREEQRQIRVTIVSPDGDERRAKILRGHDDMNCTFFRLEKGGSMPAPVPLAGAPLAVGEKAVVLGRHGARFAFAVWRLKREVEAVVTKPRTLYSLADMDTSKGGCVVATADGRLVGFLDTRTPFPDGTGLVVGIGRQVVVVVPASEYAVLQHKPNAKAWLGVNLAPFDRRREEYFNTKGDVRGAMVTGMSDGSPAAKAGAQVFDLIQSIGTFQFHYEQADDWSRMLRGVQALPLDKPLPCRIIRFVKDAEGNFVAKKMTVQIVLTERPTDFADAKETRIKELEIRVKPITTDWRRLEKLPDDLPGAVVTRVKPSTPAALAGLRSSDLIMAVDRTPVQDPAELLRILQAKKKTKAAKIVLLVRRGGETVFVPIDTNW